MIPFFKSEFSINKSILRIHPKGWQKNENGPDNIVDLCANEGIKRVYLVEDSLASFYPAYQRFSDAGIEMVYGWRINFVENAKLKEEQPTHKNVIFCRTLKGYKLMVKLANLAQVKYEFNGAHRLDYETLHEFWSDEDLVLASCFYDGFLHVNNVSDSPVIPDFRDIKPYFLWEDNDLPFDRLIQESIESYVVDKSRIVKCKSIYYKNRDDFPAYVVNRLFNRKDWSGGTLEKPNIDFMSSDEFSFESWKENAGEINKEFDSLFVPFEVPILGVRLPDVEIDQSDREKFNIPEGIPDSEALRRLVRQGYKKLMEEGVLEKGKEKIYGERVKSELKVLEETGFDKYILLVWSIVNYANKIGGTMGNGRGSCAGSLVNLLLGITRQVDPIKYNLFFERFISPARAKITVKDGERYILNGPDCDLDAENETRDKLIEYLSRVYDGRFVKLATYNCATTKILTKDVCKIAGGFSEEEAKFISDSIPVKFGKVPAPLDAINESERYKKFSEDNPYLFKLIVKLDGIIRNYGSHASAYLISHKPLDEYFPVQVGKTEDGKAEIISSVDSEVAELMVVKVDLLGLDSLRLISETAKMVGFDEKGFDYDSYENIYKYLQGNLNTPYGLFQINGDAAVRGLNKIAPKNLDQMSAVLAICRPGAFSFLDDYADFVNGRGKGGKLHPMFSEILGSTAGVCLYQEQLMQMAHKGGFTLEEADELRYIVGKKRTDKIAEWRKRIDETFTRNGYPKEAGDELFDIAEKSSNYSFNRSHSVSYSLLAAKSVYLKFNHPKEFFVNCLNLSREKQKPSEEVAKIVRELPYFGIKLLPPDLKKSDIDFTIEGDSIRFGLSSIKGVAQKSIHKIKNFIDMEKANKFAVFEAAIQAGVNFTIVSALAEVGCFDEIAGTNRQKTVLENKIWKELKDKERAWCLQNGEKYGYDLIAMLRDFSNWKINGKRVAKDSRLDTIRKACEKHIKMYKENIKRPDVSVFLFERYILGYSYSHTLRSLFNEYPSLKSVYKILNEVDKDGNVSLVCEVLDFKVNKSKKGSKYLRIDAADETGQINVLLCGEKAEVFLAQNKIKSGDFIYIKGKKGEGIIWADSISILDMTILKRANELKKLENKADE